MSVKILIWNQSYSAFLLQGKSLTWEGRQILFFLLFFGILVRNLGFWMNNIEFTWKENLHLSSCYLLVFLCNRRFTQNIAMEGNNGWRFCRYLNVQFFNKRNICFYRHHHLRQIHNLSFFLSEYHGVLCSSKRWGMHLMCCFGNSSKGTKKSAVFLPPLSLSPSLKCKAGRRFPPSLAEGLFL